MGTDFLSHTGTGLSKGHADWSNGFVLLEYRKHLYRDFCSTIIMGNKILFLWFCLHSTDTIPEAIILWNPRAWKHQ